MTQDSTIEVVVQVNGKTRGTVQVSRGAAEAAVLSRATRDATVNRAIDGKEIRKVIFVPDRLINLVV